MNIPKGKLLLKKADNGPSILLDNSPAPPKQVGAKDVSTL